MEKVMLNVFDLDSTHKMYARNVPMLNKDCTDLFVYEVGYHKVQPNRCFAACRSCYVLHYVIDGKGTFNGQKFEKGDCYLKVPYEYESVVADSNDPYETVWIIFFGSLVPTLLERCGLPHKNCVIPFKKCDDCVRMIKRCLFEKEYSCEQEEILELNSLIYKIFSKHLSPNTNKNKAKKDLAIMAAEYIEQNFSRPITVKNIADYVLFSPSYLCNIFKQKYGVSIQQYLIDLRINTAIDMLDKFKNLSVSSISENCGFKDPLYFSRVFKKRTGLSPTEYKKRQID
ncbi:MAG: AraC family transcriptional regulator [Ruminococcaceae bacterium]|nr:AraC family transcriptional regulator [Oscillospiraceae bacterium]